MLPMGKGLLRLRGMILPLLWLLLRLLLLPLRRTVMSVCMWVTEFTSVLVQTAHLRLTLMMAVVRLTVVMLMVAVRMIVVDES